MFAVPGVAVYSPSPLLVLGAFREEGARGSIFTGWLVGGGRAEEAVYFFWRLWCGTGEGINATNWECGASRAEVVRVAEESSSFSFWSWTVTVPPCCWSIVPCTGRWGGRLAPIFSGCSTYLVKKLLPQLRCSTELPFPSPPPPLASRLSPTLRGAWPSLEPREHLCERLSWSLDPWVWGQQGNPNN